MRKAVAVMASILFVFTVATVSFATEEKAAPEKAVEKSAPVRVMMVRGDVTALDAKAKTITVTSRKGEVVIVVDDTMMTGINAGDKVAVKYTQVDGKNVAKSLKKFQARSRGRVKEKKVEPAAKPEGKPAEKE